MGIFAKGDTLQGGTFYITKILPDGYSLLNDEGNGKEDDEPGPTEPTTKQRFSILRRGRQDNFIIGEIERIHRIVFWGAVATTVALLNWLVWWFVPK